MKRLLFLFFLMVSPGAANASDDIAGFWLASEKQDIVVKIENCGSDVCGHIVWLNERRAQKSPELCGQKVMWGFQKSDLPGYWEGGTVFRPNKGETYKGQISLTGPGHLTLRGYIGIPLFGESHKFIRVEEADYQPCAAIR